MGVTQSGSSGDCWRTRALSGSCGHDDVRRAGVYQAVEEGVRGDDGGAAASVREVAIAPCRVGVSVHPWIGCSGSTLLASARTTAPGLGIYGPSRAWPRERLS